MTTAALAVPRALPRGLRSVRAEASPKATIDQLVTAFEAFKEKHEARYSAIEANMDKSALTEAGLRLNGPGTNEPAADPEYRATFASYARRGAPDVEAELKLANGTGDRAAIRAAMSEGDNSAGGYLAPVEWDRQVRKAQRHLSPMRRLAQVVTSGVAGYSTLWSNESWGSGWVGETATRPQTTTASLQPLTFPTGEIYAQPAATQRLIDDALLDFEGWIATELGEEFSRQEGIAFVSGDGANKPMGFLQYLPGGAAATGTPGAHPGGELSVTVTGSAEDVTADSLIDLKYSLATPYRQGATFVMNSGTAARIAKLKDGDGAYIWREGLTLDQPATLLGRPVEIDENMPNIGAAATPIAFGDFARGYLVNDRIGVRILRDPYTAKPYVLFYATKRVGGGVLDPRAIRVLRVAAA
ncbi:phage major capsid protein [Sphingomonas qomolangmaensis]|uniref:Phage major capsid protein n=1 Tax=Sphingomonas qomolangmaensis TaxID=2918765 RepID=A0ABY5L8Q7_9SPHN|nr:phage major capsid protein [Sphingomonas qomolangmaensis]UUL82232.1 phage major capsid protein [Sphingomonas qomolangmaensis]